MRAVLSAIGKFHTFDLGRQLHARGALSGLFTGYPRFKLRGEGLPQEMIHTFPWVHGPYMAFRRRTLLGTRAVRAWEHLDRLSFDTFVAQRLPACDVFVGLSGASLKSGRRAKALGARYVCDRGSSHIRVQDRLLREEHERWGLPFMGIDPRAIEREEAEYREADLITVPSTFAMRSFLAQGLPQHKLRRLPYGVDLGRFSPSGVPDPGRFDVLFVGGMSLRKGLPYLLQAYRAFRHPRKSLTLAGVPSPTVMQLLRDRGLWSDDVRLLGHVPQTALKDLFSRSHVLVLPSIEEGLAMVQAQAMACGCPVIGSEHCGSLDLLEDSVDGFVVPIRDPAAIADRLQRLADQPALQERFRSAALEKVRGLDGWQTYGGQALRAYEGVLR